MRVDVYIPVLVAALLGLAARPLARRLSPATGARLLVGAAVGCTAGWVWALGLLAWAGIGQLPLIAHLGGWSPAVIRAANPVAPPPDQTEQIKWVNCLRANGYPGFPYPQGNQTNFNSTGIDPTSPAFLNGKANQTCGKQIGTCPVMAGPNAAGIPMAVGAIAPGANLLLIEADSASLQNRASAINVARRAAGVSVILTSWGDGELRASVLPGAPSNPPDGHTGVTFVTGPAAASPACRCRYRPPASMPRPI